MGGPAWEDPRSGGHGLGLAQLGAEPSKGLFMAFIQNRAQSVKAKLHIWQNPMEPYQNMNPSATRTHMTFRYP